MEHYMRSQFLFFGIKAPERRVIIRDFIKMHGLPESDQLSFVVRQLWNHPMCECQTAAVDLLVHAKKRLNANHLPLLEWMILTKSWWDTVDFIAPQCCGPLLKKDPYLTELYPDKWIVDPNIWLRRAALLYPLKYKETTEKARFC
ncbi:DNA alkylation repair protein [Sporolactobacillus shoreicorticis]|uniref:DNA alkylation repair protein n=1 Tax=Sporolactobacillus shoreicorticis TaxID=1923877 RepID=A0ABW5S824_9BACL|nr:DNA alkylation repair protein [Sporolactobacillus shoreicorticis]MCO7126925.1 DNA alkylation repair protein [Sporolactobacillus shoreicorticis]